MSNLVFGAVPRLSRFSLGHNISVDNKNCCVFSWG